MSEGRPATIWDVSAAETEHSAPFEGDARVDVAIVGGGYTGLSTALHCSERGVSAHVVEAQGVGHGGSGRNVGFVNPGVWLEPAKVRARLGPALGTRFLERMGDAPRLVFELIETHQIRCGATRTGTIHAAHAASGLSGLRARHDVWRALGAPVELLDRERMAEATGTRAFHGGLLDLRAGTINPLAYVRGLARAARGAGATISTGVRATGLARDGAGWRVETDRGVVRAGAVVLATNAYTDALWPGLGRVFTPIDYFQIATEPLGDRGRDILPGLQGLWDTGRIMLSLRRDGAGRIVLGSMGRVHGRADRGLTQRWAARRLARLFPGLGPVAFEEAWDGRIAMTPDHLPRILRLAEGLYAPIGYNGRGITTGTLFGQALAGVLTGVQTGADPADLPLPVTDSAPVASASVMAPLLRAAFAANQIFGGLR